MPSFANLLESKLPPRVVDLLREAGRMVATGEFGSTEAYLVGGTVRDLVVGREPADPDIVVVGSGPRLGKALAERTGGEVKATSQFGTASIMTPAGAVDVATARRETYREPGALPDVRASGMDDDLARRDFSVNAMAVSITPDTWGKLLDPQRGMSDCARRRLRVLHEQSFQDDPTRMLRAARFEVRLGFKLNVDTAEWLERDLAYMDRVSGARVLGELRKMFGEQERADVFRRAEELGLIAAISPSLRLSEKALDVMAELGDGADELLYVACLTATLTDTEAESVIERLQPEHDWRQVVSGASRYRAIASILERPDLAPSEVVELLTPVLVPVLELQRRIAASSQQREYVEAYLRRHRDVHSELTGEHLMAEGVPEGPLVGRLLRELRDGRLDMKLNSREDELAQVRRRLPLLLATENMAAGQGPAGVR